MILLMQPKSLDFNYSTFVRPTLVIWLFIYDHFLGRDIITHLYSIEIDA